MTALCMVLIDQSIFNIGATQPYFVINWIVAILIVASKNNLLKDRDFNSSKFQRCSHQK